MAEINSNSTAYHYIEEYISPITKSILTAKTEDDFNIAIENWMITAISAIEKDSKNFQTLNEDGISTILASGLRTPEINVLREANSNGHVDITIEVPNANPPRVKLGEAKIWKSNHYQVSGLNQLLNRYTTGRETRGFVVSYVKESNITGLFKGLREYVEKNKPCQLQGSCKDHVLKWSFISNHKHSSGEDLEIMHIGCNLYYK